MRGETRKIYKKKKFLKLRQIGSKLPEKYGKRRGREEEEDV